MVFLLNKIKALKFTSEPLKKTLLIVLLVVSLVSIYYILKYIVNKIKYSIRASTSNMSDEQAKLKANQLLDIFNQTWVFSSKLDAIKDVFFGVTESDYYKIFNAFSSKCRDSVLGDNAYCWLPTATSLDLTEWLSSELSNDELNDLRTYNPSLPI